MILVICDYVIGVSHKPFRLPDVAGGIDDVFPEWDKNIIKRIIKVNRRNDCRS